jgi:hypothetical protein
MWGLTHGAGVIFQTHCTTLVKQTIVEAEAIIVDATTATHGHALLRHKYGWLKGIGDVFSRLMHRERVVIAIRVPT